MPARAHTPVTTQIEKVLLPDGQMGELRLLHGDGILGPDPIRVLVVGADGRLRARSHKSETMVLVCPRPDRCHGFDAERRQVLEPDASAFRTGPAVPTYGEVLWEIEGGTETWGFRVRSASLLERTEGEAALARRVWPTMVLLLAVGLTVTFGCSMFWRVTANDRSKTIQLMKFLVGVTLCACAIVVSSFLAFLTPMTDGLFLGSIGAGILAALLLGYFRRRVSAPA